MKQTRIALMTSAAILAWAAAPAMAQQAADCSAYPKASESHFVMTPQGPKIIATAEVAVRFDDAAVVNRARSRAEAQAKEKIVKFLQEELNSEEKIKEAAEETTSITGDTAKGSYDEIIQTAKVLHSKAGAVLRGVVTLDECYTPGKLLRVTVGIKPETIAAAGALAGNINSSLAKNPTPKAAPAGAAAAAPAAAGQSAQPVDNRIPQGLNKVPGYGGSGAIEKF